MGHPQMMRDAVSDLKKQGYYRFVAIFTWTGEEDKVVLERFTPYIGHNFPPEMGIDSTTAQFYYLTGVANRTGYRLYQFRGGAGAILRIYLLRHRH